MNYLANEGAMPSVALAIVVDDELAWSGAYGESGTIDARYNAGSIAKPLTATAESHTADHGTQYQPITAESPTAEHRTQYQYKTAESRTAEHRTQNQYTTAESHTADHGTQYQYTTAEPRTAVHGTQYQYTTAESPRPNIERNTSPQRPYPARSIMGCNTTPDNRHPLIHTDRPGRCLRSLFVAS